MATALGSPQVASKPHRHLARVFRREIAPHVAALDAERVKRRAGFLATMVGAALGVPAMTALLWPLDHGWAIAAGVIGLAIAVNILGQQQRSFRHHLRRLVMPAICQAIGDLQHRAGEAPGVPFDELADLGLLPPHNWRRVDDAFTGRHRGTSFVMAEVLLRQRSRGGRRARSRKVFRGLIFAIEVPREVAGRILIARDSGALGNRLRGWVRSFSGLERVALPDPGFESRFEVYADGPERARSTVSPSLCAALTRLAESHSGRPLQGAFEGRWFYLAMPRSGDQFRLGSLFRSLGGLEQEAGQVLRDIQIVHRVIDTLHGDRPPRSATRDA